MLNVALTGNAAAGKSSVARHFEMWGATLIDADLLVRELQAPGTPVLAAIVRRFGTEMVEPAGTLDRARLRATVLADAGARRELEAIVHPAVEARRRELLDAARARGDSVVVSDIPLLFEAGDPAAFDAVVLVDAPPAIRLARLLAGRGLTPEEGTRLMAAQLPADAKRAGSTFVIENDGDPAALERRALEVWTALTRA